MPPPKKFTVREYTEIAAFIAVIFGAGGAYQATRSTNEMTQAAVGRLEKQELPARMIAVETELRLYREQKQTASSQRSRTAALQEP